MIIVVSGVAGAGKSLIGSALAAQLGWRFIEADAHHPEANIARMSAGIALTDADRKEWLTTLNELLRDAQRSRTNVVLACSALTRAHRAVLGAGLSHLRVVQLTAATTLIRGRLRARAGHFAGEELLDSQLQTLEPGGDVVVVRNESSVAEVVARIRDLLRV